MAERRQTRSRPAADKHELTAAGAGREALRQITELTGKEPEGVSGVEPTEEGWLVTAEMLDDKRIPSTTDLLSSYEIEIGLEGELMSYRRLRRYNRGQTETYKDRS
jgi:hypothetical protein